MSAFTQYVNSPTRGSNILYLVFANTSNFIINTSIGNTFGCLGYSSDHRTINFEIDCNMPTPIPTSHLNLRKSDMLSYLTSMFKHTSMFRDNDWINTVLSADNNINTLISNFNIIITDNIKQYVPIKTCRIRKQLPKDIYRLRYKTKLTFSIRNLSASHRIK